MTNWDENDHGTTVKEYVLYSPEMDKISTITESDLATYNAYNQGNGNFIMVFNRHIGFKMVDYYIIGYL
jgi:hypothetical protein